MLLPPGGERVNKINVFTCTLLDKVTGKHTHIFTNNKINQETGSILLVRLLTIFVRYVVGLLFRFSICTLHSLTSLRPPACVLVVPIK